MVIYAKTSSSNSSVYGSGSGNGSGGVAVVVVVFVVKDSYDITKHVYLLRFSFVVIFVVVLVMVNSFPAPN